jgi:PhoPQ-activated pathogenicity-related protein
MPKSREDLEAKFYDGGNQKMRKRLLAILLTLCMVAALLPTAVFAAGEVAEVGGGEI